MSKEVVLKRDVILAVAEVLLRLGKGDYEGTRKYMIRARELFETWVETRPELHERSKKFNEDQG